MQPDPKNPELDNRGNQLNDHHPAFHRARGASPEEAERLAAEARKRDEPKSSASRESR